MGTATMIVIMCMVYDGALGPVRLVRKGGAGLTHRGWDIWRHPRTRVLDDVAVLAPYKFRLKFAGDGRALGGDSWTWGNMVVGEILEGPLAGLYFLFAHLNGINVMGREGQVMPAGTVLGCEGWTGHTIPAGSDGKHLHVEVVDAWYNPQGSDKVALLLGMPADAAEGQDYTNTFRLNPAPAPAPVDPFPGVSDEELARRVWLGEFGDGDARRQALGARYDAVQALVDKGVGKPEPAPEPPAPAPVDRLAIGREIHLDGVKLYGDAYTDAVANVLPDANIGVVNPFYIHGAEVNGRVPITNALAYAAQEVRPDNTTGYIAVGDVP